MELVSFEDRGEQRIGVHQAGVVIDLVASASAAGIELPSTMVGLLEAGEPALERVEALARSNDGDAHCRQLAETQLLAPVPRPGKIFALAQNYADHAVEGGGEAKPKSGRLPLIFSKLSDSVIGPGEAILIPPVSETVDWELELAVVIGKTARHVAADAAFEYVAGYMVMNDVSARTMTYPEREQFTDLEEWFDFINGKWCDSFAPSGPFLVTRDAVPDPDNLAMVLKVNGTVWQSANTNLMIFKIPEIIAFISRWSTLRPGDVITTGTPAGCGVASSTYMKPGDVIEGTIERLGTLRNPVERS